MKPFPYLTAQDVECRVAQVFQNGAVSLLLYKDARCDMRILDETVGAENWQRHHTRDNANCTVSIWDKDKAQWIEKEDTGTESNEQAEKGLASDSFKRACFNWGIGRELYTAPFIYINEKDVAMDGKKCKSKFFVSSIAVDDGVITGLEITRNKGAGKDKAVVFTMGKNPTQADFVCCSQCGIPIKAGKTQSAEEIAQKTTEKYGAPLCVMCAKEVENRALLEAARAEVRQ